MKSKSREYKVTYLKNERKIAEISQKTGLFEMNAKNSKYL